MKKSYIAFHEEMGIYLGIHMKAAIFSCSSMAFSSKAIRFNSEEEIHNFFAKHLPSIAGEIAVIPVETTSTDYYVDVVDIIKSGHTKHVDSMIENMPMISESFH